MNKQVYLAVCGKFHAFSLASQYAARDRLGALYCADRKLSPPAGVQRSRYHNRVDIKLWRMLAARTPFRLGHSYDREHAIFDSWLWGKIRHEPGGIYHGWNTSAPQTLKRLDPNRWLRCIERSCPHNQFQHDLLRDESARLDVPYFKDPAELQSAIQELYDTDVIVAPSSYSAGSYTDPVLKKKVRVNPLGANLPLRPAPPRTAGAPRVLMVGNAFLRKGTHYLVEAFKRVRGPDAELWIRGEVPDCYRARVTDRRVKLLPAVSFDRLNELYRTATIFCLPSVDEGFGMAALEALSYGLPLIVTEHCGVRDVLSDAVAEIVPIRNPDAIADAIERVRSWDAARWARFETERARILMENTWDQCASRMLLNVYTKDTV